MIQLPVFGCPRSGTSWLGQIFNSSPHVAYRFQPLFSYEFKDYLGINGVSDQSVDAFAAAILDAKSDFVLTDLKFSKSNITHLVWKEVRYHQHIPKLARLSNVGPIIYIFRHPLYMLNSWYRAPKEFSPEWNISVEYLDAPSKNLDHNEFNGVNKWLESTALALDCQCDSVILVSYEKLLSDARHVITDLFNEVNLPVDKSVAGFVDESTSRKEADAYSVFRYKGDVEQDSEIVLPEDVVNKIKSMSEVQDRYCALMEQSI